MSILSTFNKMTKSPIKSSQIEIDSFSVTS